MNILVCVVSSKNNADISKLINVQSVDYIKILRMNLVHSISHPRHHDVFKYEKYVHLSQRICCFSCTWNSHAYQKMLVAPRTPVFEEEKCMYAVLSESIFWGFTCIHANLRFWVSKYNHSNAYHHFGKRNSQKLKPSHLSQCLVVMLLLISIFLIETSKYEADVEASVVSLFRVHWDISN